MRFVGVFCKTCRGYRTYHIRMRIVMIFIETNGHLLMKVTKSAVSTVVAWCIFCNRFSTDIYKDVIFVDAQKLEAKERDIQYRDL